MSDYDKLAMIACPTCKVVGSLSLETVLQAKPIGSFSLSGAQMKVSATEVPALVCRTNGCGFLKYPKQDPV